MDKIRANGIPSWVTIVSILLGLMGTTIGAMALLDPTAAINYVDGADRIALTWAGRNTGMGLALLAAVALRNANAYVIAYLGALFREGSDLLDSLTASAGVGSAIGLIAILVLELVCFVVCLRAARTADIQQPDNLLA